MPQILIVLFAVIGFFASVLTIVGFILQYGGHMEWFSYLFRDPKALLALIICAFVLSSSGLYFSIKNYDGARTIFPEHYKFIRIEKQHYLNESVVLDGHRFQNCSFVNVTFIWNGSAPFELINCDRSGSFRLTSKNDAINSTLLLLEGFKFLGNLSQSPELHDLFRIENP